VTFSLKAFGIDLEVYFFSYFSRSWSQLLDQSGQGEPDRDNLVAGHPGQQSRKYNSCDEKIEQLQQENRILIEY
jgi:hypothetical protein